MKVSWKDGLVLKPENEDEGEILALVNRLFGSEIRDRVEQIAGTDGRFDNSNHQTITSVEVSLDGCVERIP